jgi:hypothetical protein
MSEYWKSTPKIWCKYCKDYFRDTPRDKTQHEATPRHQGNIQRSLRTLHREKEQEERQKQRAKDEVARLNGVVGGKPGALVMPATGSVGKKEAPKQASEEDRKRQIKQLADMGVVVPEEYRREMAMAGDWQTVRTTPAPQETKVLGPGSVAFGVRKRKIEEDAEEEAAEAAAVIKHRQWGAKFKTYPGKKGRLDDGNDDVETLLGGIITKSEPREEDQAETKVKQEEEIVPAAPDRLYQDVTPTIKKEEPQEDMGRLNMTDGERLEEPGKMEPTGKSEDRAPGASIVFKKRKPKIVRQI